MIQEINDADIQDIIMLDRVNLTTPEKSDNSDACKTYKSGSFPHNDFYRNNQAEGLEFWAPTKGFSSVSTSRTRTELREVTETHAAYNWKYSDSPHHFLQAALTVTQAPKRSGETVVGQIHVHGSTRPPLKLSWDQGNIVVGFRKYFDQVNPEDTVVMTDVPLLSRWSYSIHVTQAGSLSITVNNGSRSSTTDLSLDSSWAPQGLYFKAGVYNQEDPVSATEASEGSRAIFHKISIRH